MTHSFHIISANDYHITAIILAAYEINFAITAGLTRWVDGTLTTEVTRSLSGRSIHLSLVTKWSWSLPWMTYCHPLCAMSTGPLILRYRYLKIWPWKSMVKFKCVVKGQCHIWPSKFRGQGHSHGQTHWSHLRPGVQSDRFWLRYSKFYIWPWKFQSQGHGQGQTCWSHLRPWVQSICLLFVSWQSDHFWLR